MVRLLTTGAVFVACAFPQIGRAQRQSKADVRPQAIASQRRSAITEAVAKVSPTVVTVQTEAVQRVTNYDFFFGQQSRDQTSAGIGSGFIIRADGVILTNAHVVAGATKISVALRDGQTYNAKLLGSDEMNDLAVLQISAKNLPVAALGTSRGLLIGEWAIAIGNPYGFVLGNSEPSVSLGVISATGRNLTARSEVGGRAEIGEENLWPDAAVFQQLIRSVAQMFERRR